MSSIIQTHPKDPLTAITHSREDFLHACRTQTDFHAVLWVRPNVLIAARKLYDDMNVIRRALNHVDSNLLIRFGRLGLIRQAIQSQNSETKIPYNVFSNMPLIRDDFLLASELIDFGDPNLEVMSMDMYHEKNNPKVQKSPYDTAHIDKTNTLYCQYAGARLRIHPDPSDLTKTWKVPCGGVIWIRPECHHSRAPRYEIWQKGRLARNFYAQPT